MTPQQQIKIIDLLHQREVAFLRVWECEEKLRQFAPFFPIPPPPDLPCRHRMKPAERKAFLLAEKQGKDPGLSEQKSHKTKSSFRSLQPEQGENCYQIRYCYKGEEGVSYQKEQAILDTLLHLKSPEFQLLEITTVRYLGADQVTAVECLYSATDSTP